MRSVGQEKMSTKQTLLVLIWETDQHFYVYPYFLAYLEQNSSESTTVLMMRQTIKSVDLFIQSLYSISKKMADILLILQHLKKQVYFSFKL